MLQRKQILFRTVTNQCLYQQENVHPEKQLLRVNKIRDQWKIEYYWRAGGRTFSTSSLVTLWKRRQEGEVNAVKPRVTGVKSGQGGSRG